MLGDFHSKHPYKGDTYYNNRGIQLNNLINRGIIKYIGPEFGTYIGPNRLTKIDDVYGNRYSTLNIQLERGQLTSSDHYPVVFTVATVPIVQQTRKTYAMKNAK